MSPFAAAFTRLNIRVIFRADGNGHGGVRLRVVQLEFFEYLVGGVGRGRPGDVYT